MTLWIHRVVLLALFAFWFGGFTFYTAVVVPIGTDVLGSSRTQGFVTQQVTHWLNLIGGAALLAFVVDAIWFRHDQSKRHRILLWVLIVGLALLWTGLVFVHPVLDRMLDAENEFISDENSFYQWHRLYLWLSTVQWLLLWGWLILWARGNYRQGPAAIT